jgi:hypothetical protein
VSTDISAAPSPEEQIRRWASQPSLPEAGSLQKRALLGAGIGAVCFLGLGYVLGWFGAVDLPRQFFLSYLVAFIFWFGVGLGCLTVLMIQHLTGGSWGLLLRRVLEAGACTLILMGILFIPLLFGMRSLYEWAQPVEEISKDPLLAHKYPYLNPTWFILRGIGYFAVWVVLVVLLRRWSARQDQEPGGQEGERCRILSGPGLVLLGITVSFAVIDWMMSLEPHWYSSIYPAMVGVGCLLSGFAFAVAVLLYLGERPPLAEVLSSKHLGDMGSLMLAFVMLWAYMCLSQFLLIWAGNLKEEIPWYLYRTRAGWGFVAVPLILFHFFVPFLLLLSRNVKTRRVGLLSIAVGLLVVRFVDVFWLIEPPFAEHGPSLFVLLDLSALVGVGGIWVWFFVEQLRQKPILPVGDPALAEVLKHE